MEATRFEYGGSYPAPYPIVLFVINGGNTTQTYKIVFNGDQKVVTETLINQVLSTFKFLDQPNEEKFCGGIAGIVCPSDYKCLLDGNYPDAGGKCVKE